MGKQTDAQPQTAMVPAGDVPEFVGLTSITTAQIGELIRENFGASGLSIFDFPKVDLPAGGGTAWEVPSLAGPTYTNTLEGIIIMAQDHRVYYRDAYQGGGEKPDCSSKDALVAEEDGDPGGWCEKCPLAKWGSSEKGRGQACSLRKQIVLLRPHEFFPIMVDLPPSALGELRKYMIALTSAGKLLTHVATAITLRKEKNAAGIEYSKPDFRLLSVLDAETAARGTEYGKAIRSIIKLQDLAADVEAATSSDARTELSHIPAPAEMAAPANADSDDPFGGN